MSKHARLTAYFKSLDPVNCIPQQEGTGALLNLSRNNPALTNEVIREEPKLTEYVNRVIADAGASYAYGGFFEQRRIYERSENFDGLTARTFHIGTDLWAPAGTPVMAPLDGIVHSFADNDGFGNYGPTIILEHDYQGDKFYSLYGHLSRGSLKGVATGQYIQRGDVFADLGTAEVNGDYPPHLHLQFMTEIFGYQGDYPGVVAKQDVDAYQKMMIDPKLILRIVWT